MRILYGLTLAVLLTAVPLLSARAETAAAHLTFKKSSYGIPGGGSGTITFHLDPARKSFTCTLSGTGKLSGSAVIFGTQQQITATISLAQTSCSGRYFPEQGTVDGRISISGTYRSTATYRATSGETLSESDSGTESESGAIMGNLGPGGRGVIETSEGTMNWSVTRPVTVAGPATATPEPKTTTVAPQRPDPATNSDRPQPGARPAPERPAPAGRPEPDQTDRPEQNPPEETPAESDETPDQPEPDPVSEEIKNSFELTNLVMDDFKRYQAGGGRLNFSSFLQREYADPAERERVETAVRVAAEEKERRETQLDQLYSRTDQMAGEIINRYHQEALAPAAGEPAPSFTEYLTRVITDPAERERLQQAAVFSAVNAYSRAEEGYQAVVGKLKSATSRVEQIFKSIAGQGSRAEWLRQQATDAGIDQLKSMMPEQLVENAESFYGQYQGIKENFDAVQQARETIDDLKAKKDDLMAKYREGKLEADGVRALHALDVLHATVNSDLVPDLGGYKSGVINQTLGRAVKFTNDAVVYKTSVRGLSPDVTDAQIERWEQARAELKKYGQGETHKPYNPENAWVTLFKSAWPFAPKETPAHLKKYR